MIERQQSIRRDAGRISAGIVVYLCLMLAMGVLQVVVKSAALMERYGYGAVPSDAYTEMLEQLASSGAASLAAAAIGLVFLSFFYRNLDRGDLFARGRKMDARHFFIFLAVLMSVQYLFMASGAGIEALLNLFGLSMQSEVDSATQVSTTVSMFLYTSVAAPVVEELIFRGYVLRTLQKYGKVFAIVVSALLFGIYHGNLAQMPFAFLFGVVCGYIALEYSVFWSMAFHFINNCIFGDLIGQLRILLGDDPVSTGFAVILIVFIIVAVVAIAAHRQDIAAYLRRNRTPKGSYLALFASAWVIVLFVMNLGLAWLGLDS